MNWFLILSAVAIVAIIISPIIWLFYKAYKNGEFEGDDVSQIAAIKRLEMIESMNDKQNKS